MNPRIWAAALAVALVLTGCWSRREMNDLAMVMGVGVDLTEDGQLEVTLGVALPGAAGGGKGDRPRVIVQRRGRTMSEAIRLAELAVPRRVVLSHSRVFIIGERLARSGVDALLDFLLRSPQIRLNANIMLLRGAAMVELFQIQPLMDPLQSQALREVGSNLAGLETKLKDLFIARAAGYTAPILPVVSLRPHPPAGRGDPQLEAELSGAALFAEDRLVAYLDTAEVRGVIWIRGQARYAIITTECPQGPEQYTSVRMDRTRRRIRPVVAGGRVSFDVTLTGDVYITDVQCMVDLSDLQVLNTLQDAIESAIADRAQQAVRRAQEVPADPFGFGEYVRALLPQVWRRIGREDWPEVWAKTPVRIHAKIRLVHLEMISAPPPLREPDRNK